MKIFTNNANRELPLSEVQEGPWNCPAEQRLPEARTRPGQSDPRDRTLHTFFEEQARKTPAAIAVEYNGRQLTYAELNEQSDRLAAVLRSRGVGPEILVGICLERSLDMVVAVLGTLKSGGAYVPLDPAFPQERLAMMVEDSRMPLILTQRKLLESLPQTEAQKLCLDGQLPVPAEGHSPSSGMTVRSENLAYVLFTSGSTGRPKGVEIPHRALVNFLCSVQREPGLQAGGLRGRTAFGAID